MNLLLDLLFPPRCAFCGALMDRPGEGVCPDCVLPLVPPEKILRPVGERGYPCAVALYYDGPVQTGVRAMKFQGKSWRTKVFARYIVQAAAEHLSGSFDAVTYVPVSPRRRFVRGYDQAQILAREAAGIWGVRAERTLRKVRHNRAQSSLSSPRERQENVKNAYAVPRPGQVPAHRRRVYHRRNHGRLRRRADGGWRRIGGLRGSGGRARRKYPGIAKNRRMETAFLGKI